MQNKFKLTLATLCLTSTAFAQSADTLQVDTEAATLSEEAVFTFTESQLGEDDDMSQNVTIISSNNNLYASQVGYSFSPMRFRYRALNQKYNDVFVNGMQLNDMETGQFRFTLVGGLNNQTRSQESSLPFEDNLYSLSGMGGSNNYDFRAGDMATGHKASLLFANRNYQLRAMYTYNSGFNNDGWAWSASLTYRGATYETQKWNPTYKGSFYNSLSYFFGIEKILGDHRISLSTWGNPTERTGQGAGTEEVYHLANNYFYNPYWGYQNGKIRNSRIVNDFAPSAVLTWDWKISNKAKLTTSFGGRYSMYKSTSLDYNNADNPHPDYWKNMPSAYNDVFNTTSIRNNDYTFEEWHDVYNYLTASESNLQVNWDRLYAANRGVNAQGTDAMYFIKAKHNDALTLQLNSVLNYDIDNQKHLTLGLGLGSNHGRHYMSIDDLLGATNFHNVNTFAISSYGQDANEVQYDLNNPSRLGDASSNLKEGDKYRYDYFINVRKANLWGAFTANKGRLHYLLGAKASYVAMQRDGQMKNGLAENNSYGKSGTSQFADGGFKTAATVNLGKGNAFNFGVGYELRAPQASTVFAAPEINNDFCLNLKNEKVVSSELGYQHRSSRVSLNISAFYNLMKDVTEWQNYYFDDNNSFTYVSMTGINKSVYGVEAGMRIKLTGSLDFKALGTISEAKYDNDCNARYMLSKRYEYVEEKVMSKGMRESGTPLTATSLGLSYHRDGWFIDLSGNWYDRIYLSWSPSLRYESVIAKRQSTGEIMYDNNGEMLESAFAQAKGHGGWMVDASIGKSMYLRHGSLSINVSLTNILNNTKIITGGYEQSRTSYTKNSDGTYSQRIYNFNRNTKMFHAYGTNGMLNITYKF